MVQEWRCGGCQGQNFSPKTKCATCGMRKSYAQALLQQPMSTEPSTQMDECTAQHVIESTCNHEFATPIPPHQKAKLLSDIKALETALKHLPEDPDFRTQRDMMSEKIAVRKKQIVEARPIGQRLDRTRDALARARKRQALAEETLAQAHATVQATTDESDKLSMELATLESQLVPTYPSEPLRFQALESHLAAAIEELRGSSFVHAAAVSEAESQVCELLDKFKCTLLAAKRAEEDKNGANAPAAGAGGAEAPSASRRSRLIGKQSAQAPHKVRIVGKQPTKRKAVGAPTAGTGPRRGFRAGANGRMER